MPLGDLIARTNVANQTHTPCVTFSVEKPIVTGPHNLKIFLFWSFQTKFQLKKKRGTIVSVCFISLNV